MRALASRIQPGPARAQSSSAPSVSRRQARRATGLIALVTTLGLALVVPSSSVAGQQRSGAPLERVRTAAFEHWWPKHLRLMRTLMENQDVDSGRLRVPAPSPEDFQREIQVATGFSNPYLPGYTFFGVHTQGAVFEGLFLMDPSGEVRVLVNHDDPEDRKPIIEDAYVDHMNGILDRSGVRVDEPREAASLTRFFLSTFFNFTLHHEGAAMDSTVQDELQRVRVISDVREIPRGRRPLSLGSRKAFLIFEPVPPEVRGVIRPPVVRQPEHDAFVVELFTWHPVRGEVKGWEVRIARDRFAYFRDQTVARWKPYRFEGTR